MLLEQIAAFTQWYQAVPEDTLPALEPYSEAAKRAVEHNDLPALTAIYHTVYPLLEQEIWDGQAFYETLDLYQSLFREQETLIQLAGK